MSIKNYQIENDVLETIGFFCDSTIRLPLTREIGLTTPELISVSAHYLRTNEPINNNILRDGITKTNGEYGSTEPPLRRTSEPAHLLTNRA